MSETVLAGRYRLEARIGHGGMAEVWRGFDTVLNRTVAVKVLSPQYARDTGFVDRFRREAQAAARLNQPNIVGVYDTGSDGETQFIVMEFIEGRTLAEFMAGGGSFTPMQAVDVAAKICQALAYAHERGVIHRDIKPANVMVTRQGEVKVMDFGIARIMAGPETAPQTSAVLGTAAYISPEQAQGHPVNGRADIYSLGVVLYEMLAGRPPFVGTSPVSIAYKHVNETPPPPSTHRADVPPALDAVVMRSLAKNPANRYQGAAEFEADLERVREGQPVQATPLMAARVDDGGATQVISRERTSVLPPQMEQPGSGRKIWLGALIGVLIVAILAGGGYLVATSLLSENGDTPSLVTVPSVIGLPEADATSQLEARGLKVDPKKRVTDKEDPGTVVDQDPAGNERVDRGTTVTIWVAKAPTTVEVPDLVGKTVDEARGAVGQDFVLGEPQEQSSDQPEGVIISQTPLAGEQAEPGTTIEIVVSSGPATITLDDYTCRPYGSAKADLEGLGLQVVQQFSVPNTLCPNPNRVAGQDPSPGTELQPGDTVTLFTGSTSPSPTGEG